MLSDNIVYMFE